jgi:hypothetical protein
MVKQHCSGEPDSLETDCVSCFLQQGMVSMPGIISMPAIWQRCSSWSRPVPASTLPPITSARIRDENRFSIAKLSIVQINIGEVKVTRPQGVRQTACKADAEPK